MPKIITHKNISYLEQYIPDNNGVFVIIDNKVKDYFCRWKNWNFIGINASEKNKTLATAEAVYSELMDMRAGKDCFVIGAGGGVTTDLAGFVASTYKRGVRFGLVATTLLAAADAAIGGKNGLNASGIKNMVGTVSQPLFTYLSTDFFRSLDARVFKEGAAEVLKTFILFDSAFLEKAGSLLRGYDNARPSEKKEATLRKLIARCARLKAEIVEEDEFDNGVRMSLNLGHTFGHAIEAHFASNKQHILHGEAVAAGIAASATLASLMNFISESRKKQITDCLDGANLPYSLGIKALDLLPYMENDKKARGGKLRLVLPAEETGCTFLDISFQNARKLFRNTKLIV